MRIAETDWQLFSTLKYRALDRCCRATLIEASEICAQPLDAEQDSDPTSDTSAHHRYLQLYRVVTERNRQIAETFDGHSRSGAILQLMQLVRMDLLTSDELAEFSDETQAFIERAHDHSGINA